MSAFDDFSHRGGFPAFFELAVHLRKTHLETEFFGELTPLEFVSRFRRHWDRGLKWTALVYSVRAAIESQSARGHGNRARRRSQSLKKASR